MLYSAPPSASARSAHVRLCPAPSRLPQAPHRACALPRAPRLQNPAWTFYVELARESFAKGYTLFKIHGTGKLDLDIAICRACREAFPDKKFAIDPVNVFDRCESMTLGRVCDELNFEWLESPMDDFDIECVKEHVYSRSYGKEDTVKETRKGCPSHDRHARRAGIQLIRQFGIRDDVIRLAQRHQHIRARLQKLRLVAEEHLHVRLL